MLLLLYCVRCRCMAGNEQRHEILMGRGLLSGGYRKLKLVLIRTEPWCLMGIVFRLCLDPSSSL